MNDLNHATVGAARMIAAAIAECGRAIAIATRELKTDQEDQ